MNRNTSTTLALGQKPTIDNSGVDMQTILQEWKLSHQFVYTASRDFQSLDNLVDGIALQRLEDNPFVGDVTLAGLVRSIPRDSLQQLPVFAAVINGTKNSIPAILATYFLKKYIFNEDTFGKGLLSTLQIGAEQALTHGFAAFMNTTGTMYDEFGSLLQLIHHEDLGLEPGIQDASQLGYDYVVANLTKTRVRKILANAKTNPNTSWNVQALQRVLETEPKSRAYQQWESAARRNPNLEGEGPTYQFITRHETGPNAVNVTFSPDLEDAPLRVMDSKSKFGYPRVQLLVIDPAPLTPFGVSRVKLASPIQNLMNIYLGNTAAMLLLNSAPPIFKRGRFSKQVELKRNAVWETLDQNASADLKSMDNGALKEFVSMMTYLSGQIQIIMGKGPSSSALDPAGQAAPSKGKGNTATNQDDKDASSNQITKILENFLRQYAISGLDTMLSEQEGEDEIIVDDDTMNKINNLAPGTVGDDHKVLMTWERFYAAIESMSVEIDISVSKDQMKDKQRADLQDMLVVLAQNASDLGPDAAQKVQEITAMLMQDIAPDVKPIQADVPGAAQAAQQQQAAGPGQSAVQGPNGGSQVHETGDLVKMFGMTTDPDIRNAILGAMGLPQKAAALPAELVNPINPVAQTSMTGGAPAGDQQPQRPAPVLTR